MSWLTLVTGLGLGACLADDMGLGKTVQVIGLLLHRKSSRTGRRTDRARPSLLVVPASLLANWKAELERFAPTLSFLIAHPSENTTGKRQVEKQDAQGLDLLITTYGMLSRTEWLRQRDWDLVILDEAQAIKNSGTRQSRTVKELKAAARVAMTGTPVENRLSDLWSLFDFLNPGLLGGAKSVRRLWSSKWRPDRRTSRSAPSSGPTFCAGSRPTSESSPTCPKRSRCRPSAR